MHLFFLRFPATQCIRSVCHELNVISVNYGLRKYLWAIWIGSSFEKLKACVEDDKFETSQMDHVVAEGVRGK